MRAFSFLSLLFIALTSFITSPLIPTLQAVFLGSSFIGMTDPKRLSRIQIGLTSIVFSFIFHYLVIYLKGAGGVLGFAAFTSCLIVHFIWHTVTHQSLRFKRPESKP